MRPLRLSEVGILTSVSLKVTFSPGSKNVKTEEKYTSIKNSTKHYISELKRELKTQIIQQEKRSKRKKILRLLLLGCLLGWFIMWTLLFYLKLVKMFGHLVKKSKNVCFLVKRAKKLVKLRSIIDSTNNLPKVNITWLAKQHNITRLLYMYCIIVGNKTYKQYSMQFPCVSMWLYIFVAILFIKRALKLK